MFWDKLERRNLTVKDANNFTWNSLNSIDVESDALKESTYFKCIKYISESVAKIPICVKQEKENGEFEAKEHKLYEKLRLRPNSNMTAIDCIKALVALGEHFGVSGLYIDRNTMDLYPAKINQIIIDDVGLISSNKNNKILYQIIVGNEEVTCLENDLILYKSGLSFDGINTKANKQLLKGLINTNIKAQKYLAKLFDNGLTNKIVVQMASDIKDKKKLEEVQNMFKNIFSNNGRIFTVPAGYTVNPLNLSLADSQFEQIRKLSRKEIANAFGLNPALIGDLSNSSNNNMDVQSSAFLNDTLLIKLQQLEQEFDWKYLNDKDRKAGYKVRFKQEVMLRTSAKTQCDIINAYVKSGVYSLDDARGKLGLPKIEGGDAVLVPSGYYKLEDLSKITLSKVYKNGGDNGE